MTNAGAALLTEWVRQAMRFIDLCDADPTDYSDRSLHEDAEALTIWGYALFGLREKIAEASLADLEHMPLLALSAHQITPAAEPEHRQYVVGPLTMERVFTAAGLTNMSDMQAVLDSIENALSSPSTTRPAPIAHVDADSIIALLDRAREDAASGRMKGLALGAIGVDEHVTAYTFDDDDPDLRRLLARTMLAVAYEIADGRHEEAGR